MAIDVDAYPAPRANRPGPAPGGGARPAGGGALAAAAPLGTVRLWPFTLFVGAGLNSVVVSPFYRGPAVITNWMCDLRTGAMPQTPMIGVYVSSDDTGARAQSANAARPTGELIFDEHSDGANATYVPREEGVNVQGDQPRIAFQDVRLNYIVRLPRFTCKVVIGSAAASGDYHVSGFLRVVEGVSEADLASFL